MAASSANFTKDPDDVLDYSFDWTSWLGGSDTITGFTAIASPGITVQSSSFTTVVTIVWLSGGTSGIPYTVTHRITTALGRTKDLTMTFRVTEN